MTSLRVSVSTFSVLDRHFGRILSRWRSYPAKLTGSCARPWTISLTLSASSILTTFLAPLFFHCSSSTDKVVFDVKDDSPLALRISYSSSSWGRRENRSSARLCAAVSYRAVSPELEGLEIGFRAQRGYRKLAHPPKTTPRVPIRLPRPTDSTSTFRNNPAPGKSCSPCVKHTRSDLSVCRPEGSVLCSMSPAGRSAISPVHFSRRVTNQEWKSSISSFAP